MAKLPPRRILRSIVQDAISDREEFDDANHRREPSGIVLRYRAFLPRLADSAPPLGDEDRELLATACRHARIWREGYLDSWKCTGEKAVLLEARQDVDRVTRTEDALGVVRHWMNGGPMPDDVRSVSILELASRPIEPGTWSGGGKWFTPPADGDLAA